MHTIYATLLGSLWVKIHPGSDVVHIDQQFGLLSLSALAEKWSWFRLRLAAQLITS